MFNRAVITTATAAGAPLCEVLAHNNVVPSLVGTCSIVELNVQLVNAVASTIALAYSHVPGTVPGGGVGEYTLVGDNPHDFYNGQVELLTAWTTPPTIFSDATNSDKFYIRRVTLPAVAGSAVSWTWSEDNPLVINPKNSGSSAPQGGPSLVLLNAGAGACDTLLVSVRLAIQTIQAPVKQSYPVGT